MAVESTTEPDVNIGRQNESPVGPGDTGASHGLLDRKEVLGGE